MDSDHPSWEVLREQWCVESLPSFLKHLFNKHDGELRVIREAGWRRVPNEFAGHPRFWHPQFARTEDLRRTLYWRQQYHKGNGWLYWGEIEDIFREQPHGQTTLLRGAYDASGALFQVDMRMAQVVTLPQMFFLGSKYCTAYDIYKHYMDLPVIIHKHKRENKTWREEVLSGGTKGRARFQ